MKQLYFDYASAAPLEPRVARVLRRLEDSSYANPSSTHALGREARALIDAARSRCADILGCTPREIVFTHSGTEANNLALFGLAGASSSRKQHVVISSIEHESIRQAAFALRKKNFLVSELPVNSDGRIEISALSKVLRSDTAILSFVIGNNEIGVVQDVNALVAAARKISPNIRVHIDACQYAPFYDLDVRALGVDALTCNSSKLCGPKGVGMLFVREGVSVEPLLFGGGQEYGLWSGTENVVNIVGFSEAFSHAQNIRVKESQRIAALRDMFFSGLQKFSPDIIFNGSQDFRLPHIVHVTFPGIDTETLLIALDQVGICASSGSACRSGALESSYVLRALGGFTQGASVRFSFGRFTTRADIQEGIHRVRRCLKGFSRVRS